MITGFNTDIEYNGKVYHVQTEDRGRANPVVESLVYTGGEIIAARKSPYAELLDAGGYEEVEIQRRMENQHRELIREIRSGSFDPDDQLPFGHAIVTNRSLDEVVLQFLVENCALERLHLEVAEPSAVWEGEPAKLRIRVIDPDTDRPVNGATVVAALVATGAPPRELVSATSGKDGCVELMCNIPRAAGTDASLVCRASVPGTSAETERRVKKRTDEVSA